MILTSADGQVKPRPEFLDELAARVADLELAVQLLETDRSWLVGCLAELAIEMERLR